MTNVNTTKNHHCNSSSNMNVFIFSVQAHLSNRAGPSPRIISTLTLFFCDIWRACSFLSSKYRFSEIKSLESHQKKKQVNIWKRAKISHRSLNCRVRTAKNKYLVLKHKQHVTGRARATSFLRFYPS